MSDKISLFDLSYTELEAFFLANSEPSFRTKQIWEGMYKQYWNKPNEFSIFKPHLQKIISQNFKFENLMLVSSHLSNNGKVQKCLFKLGDGNVIETVLMSIKNRNTICLSTQSGCGLGCIFCATGHMGYKRNLTSGEIVEQVLYFSRLLKVHDLVVTNIVFMGMGEPFQNYDALSSALKIITNPYGLNFADRRITVSTVGLVPMINRFADEYKQINLAISLHAANDELRSKLVPINRKYPLNELFRACKCYIQKTNRRISFEWVMIQDVNDTQKQATLLVKHLRGMLCHVNLILLNRTQEFLGLAPSTRRARIFQRILIDAGIPCTIRQSYGQDIHAGCGQLALRKS